jgi:hypothetical protein
LIPAPNQARDCFFYTGIKWLVDIERYTADCANISTATHSGKNRAAHCGERHRSGGGTMWLFSAESALFRTWRPDLTNHPPLRGSPVRKGEARSARSPLGHLASFRSAARLPHSTQCVTTPKDCIALLRLHWRVVCASIGRGRRYAEAKPPKLPHPQQPLTPATSNGPALMRWQPRRGRFMWWTCGRTQTGE